MIALSNQLIREAIKRNNLPAASPDHLHILGIRSARRVDARSITRVEPLPDQWDDLIVVFGTALEAFPATVDPGVKYGRNPINPRGTAHLCDGGPYSFAKGKHKGKSALVQAGAFRIWRDADRDNRHDAQELCHPESGIGINLHRGRGPVVGPWSAGCQVIPEQWWEQFYRHIEASGQTRFSYWLIDGSRLV